MSNKLLSMDEIQYLKSLLEHRIKSDSESLDTMVYKSDREETRANIETSINLKVRLEKHIESVYTTIGYLSQEKSLFGVLEGLITMDDIERVNIEIAGLFARMIDEGLDTSLTALRSQYADLGEQLEEDNRYI